MRTAERGDTSNYNESLIPNYMSVNFNDDKNEFDNLVQHAHSEYNVDNDDLDGVTMIQFIFLYLN